MEKQSSSFLIISILLTGVFISCKKEKSCEGCINGNKPPIAVAGPDQSITLPTDSISLDGSASNDPDGTISVWLWKKIEGPASFNIVNSSVNRTVVKNLVAGTYQFELKVTDDKGASARDTMLVIVDAIITSNRPPVANAGAHQTIILPTNSITVDGSGSTDPDNNITSYLWTKISGPSSFNIVNANAVQTQVTNLAEGVYQFELKVTDAGGLFSKDTVQVMVQVSVFDANVYVAGAKLIDYVYKEAVLWENGLPQRLSDPQSYYAHANAVFVSGSDVYVAGTQKLTSSSKSVAKLWKNGAAQNLTDGAHNAGAFSVFVSGSDVFVAGIEENANNTFVAKLWKNGVAQNLSGGNYATSVFVSAGDVYVAGSEGSTNSVGTYTEVAKLWKNGVVQNLSDGSYNYARAWSVCVSGSDVYVAGTVSDGNQYTYSDENGTYSGNYSVAKLWKNGVAQNLSDGQYNGNAHSVFVSGSDVYVAGYEVKAMYENMVGKLWKNGVATNLNVPNSANYFAPWSVFVSGSDVYVAGDEIDFFSHLSKAKLWKNGVTYILEGVNTARSVFVK